jgi:hypothetical protein
MKDEAGYDVHSPCQRPLPGRYSRRTDLWGRRREKVLDLLEVGQGGGVKVFLEVGLTPVLQEPQGAIRKNFDDGCRT